MVAMRPLFVLLVCVLSGAQDSPFLSLLKRQAARTAQGDPKKYPEQTRANFTGGLNTWVTGGAGGWTSGFFPGTLWQLYAVTKDETWLHHAKNWTEGIRTQQHNTGTHDIGFMVFDSFGRGAQIAPDQVPDYKEVVFTAASSLATRFNPTVGCTMSWNPGHHCREHPTVWTNFTVIIDNMMNLELLLWSAQHVDDPVKAKHWRDVAISHANTTSYHHVRPDGSSYHVVNYDSKTGGVLNRCTAQGFHDETTWSRGQSWCVNGFTMVYRYTRIARFLETAQRCADFFIKHLEPDSIPLWDFNWDGPRGYRQRDSSAAAIAASALVDLAEFSANDRVRADSYRTAAKAILTSLNGPHYLGDFLQTEGTVLHATGFYGSPGSVDVTLIYADYYALEAARKLAS